MLDVLIAEDNEINQQVVSMTLELTKLTYRIVENGRDAVEAWKALKPKIIIMDISMPVMDGCGAAIAIREAEAGTGNHVPIVAMTAHAMRGDRERCMAAGMDDYMQKPVTPDALIGKIEQWLDGADGRARMLIA